MALRRLQPTMVILYEPYLEFMRAIEVYNAERTKLKGETAKMEVHLMMYEESSELY